MKIELIPCLLAACFFSDSVADEVVASKEAAVPQASEAAGNKTTGDSKSEPSEVKLVEGDWKSIQQLVKKSRGKVVVVDIWSTACPPCMREYPNLLRLQKTYGKKVVCVSLNVDYVGIKSKPPEYYRPKVEKFLNRVNSTCHNYLCSIDGLKLFDELNLNSIPAVYLFGTDGKLVKRFDDELLEDGEEDAFTYKDDINPVIEKLMAAKGQ